MSKRRATREPQRYAGAERVSEREVNEILDVASVDDDIRSVESAESYEEPVSPPPRPPRTVSSSNKGKEKVVASKKHVVSASKAKPKAGRKARCVWTTAELDGIKLCVQRCSELNYYSFFLSCCHAKPSLRYRTIG